MDSPTQTSLAERLSALAATQIKKRRAVESEIRRDFPLCTAAADHVRAEFGPGVKPTYFSEGGKTMGKRGPDFEDNTYKWEWLAMTETERNKSLRGAA